MREGLTPAEVMHLLGLESTETLARWARYYEDRREDPTLPALDPPPPDLGAFKRGGNPRGQRLYSVSAVETHMEANGMAFIHPDETKGAAAALGGATPDQVTHEEATPDP